MRVTMTAFLAGREAPGQPRGGPAIAGSAIAGSAIAGLSRLYAACGRAALAMVASASPGRVLTMAAALTRPAASLASLQLVLLGIAAVLLACLMTGVPARDLAGSLMLLAASAGVLWAMDWDEAAALTAALRAGLTAIVLSCLPRRAVAAPARASAAGAGAALCAAWPGLGRTGRRAGAGLSGAAEPLGCCR